MKIVQINAVYGRGSTGKICMWIADLLKSKGHESITLCSSKTGDSPKAIACATPTYTKIQSGLSRAFGNYGFNSTKETKRMIAQIEQIKPDIVHLHNIHGHDCNLELLFTYFKKNQTKLIWTFHDCWAFTGYCIHFVLTKCDKWKTTCNHCPQKKYFSWFVDGSQKNHQRKQELFSELDLTIVTPSWWLADLVKQSFLKDYPVKVINNGIDLSVFQPVKSDFRKNYGISPEKKILLGVSFGWGYAKGVDVFVELAKRLDPAKYQIVMVGTNKTLDQQLPKQIISIHRTNNQQELAQIYSAADLFVNPTRQENYPTVNMEAIACGTPVLTFRTGGSPEIVDTTTGSVVDVDDMEGMLREIERICNERPYSVEDCIQKAKSFDMYQRFEEYIKLYEESYNSRISF